VACRWRIASSGAGHLASGGDPADRHASRLRAGRGHAQGLVHRDIKPATSLLENGVERVKITDFGPGARDSRAQSTQSNVVAGTPQYMSPEQAVARPSITAATSSASAASCTPCAWAVRHCRAETPTGAIHRVCEDSPRPIREVNPDIPERLVAIVDRLLAKKREDRFQSATEVADVLGQYLAHVQQPSQVALPSARRTLGTSQRQRQVWPWVAAAAGSILLVTLFLRS